MARERLPDRRTTNTFTFVVGSPGEAPTRYQGSVGFYEDGRPAEVFLYAGKPGTPVEAACRDAAVVTSLLLQYGCPIKEIRDALTQGHDGEPAGPIGTLLSLIEDTFLRGDGGTIDTAKPEYDGTLVPDN